MDKLSVEFEELDDTGKCDLEVALKYLGAAYGLIDVVETEWIESAIGASIKRIGAHMRVDEGFVDTIKSRNGSIARLKKLLQELGVSGDEISAAIYGTASEEE